MIYRFYPGDGGPQFEARHFASDAAAERHGAQLCAELGIEIEIARGEELDLIGICVPDEDL